MHNNKPPAQPKIGGFVPFSSCDWPGKIVAVVFISGCPWRCGYCHNPHLQSRQPPAGAPQWDDILAFLQTRTSLLDGVVFSGGEPLIEPQLANMLTTVRAMGYQTALHTGGAYPNRLAECLTLLDWVGLDIKTEFDDYERITGVTGSGNAAKEALKLIINSKIDFECRTTTQPNLHTKEQLARIKQSLSRTQYVASYKLQTIRSSP